MKQLVIIPGGFHPFHQGHKSLYDAAQKAFPRADIYIAASDDISTRPFPFKLKKQLAMLAGIPSHRFIEVKSPFSPKEITEHYDADNTVLIYVRSEKDRDTSPQPGGKKKNGEDSYLQPTSGLRKKDLESMSRHGYMAYLPTIMFGADMTSSTEIRDKWPMFDNKQKVKLLKTLYPAISSNKEAFAKVTQMFDQILGTYTPKARQPSKTDDKPLDESRVESPAVNLIENTKTILNSAIAEFKNGNQKDLDNFLSEWERISEIVSKLKETFYLNEETSDNTTGYDVLDEVGCGPFDGGCLLVAKALQKIHGGEIVVLVDKNDRAQHAAVMLPNGKLIDHDGAAFPEKFIRRFEKNEIAKITGTRGFKNSDLPTAARDFHLVPKLVSALK